MAVQPFAYTPDPLLVILLALALDAALGDLSWLFRLVPHPVVVIGRVIAYGDRKLNRVQRSQRARGVRGALLALGLVATAVAVGWGVEYCARSYPYGWLAEALAASLLLAQRGLFDAVRRVGRALRDGGLDAGRMAVAHIVGRDPASLDEHGVARAAVESCAENFSDAVVGPVFWFVVAGFPGLLAYKTVNTLDSMIGYRNDHYLAFGMVAARLDDAMNLLPARLSGLILVAAALFAPRARPWQALRVMLRDARNHRSPNSGWPEAAMAGALNLGLGGPRRYGADTVLDKWIGDGRARVTVADIGDALWMFAVACLLNFGWVAALFWAKWAV